MFRKALLTALVIIIGSGLTVTAASGTAAASPSACPVSAVIEITSFAFSPPAVAPGRSSTATLTAVNCTDQSQQTSQTWYGQWAGPATGVPPAGCPAIDPIARPVTFPPDGTVSESMTYSVPSSCTATQLTVTANIYGTNGALLAHGTAVLQIIRPALPAAANPA
jgi:hypothetical protein